MLPPFAQPLATHATGWNAGLVRVTLNVTLDAAIVPSEAEGGARLDTGHLVVLDDFFGEPERCGLLDFITEAGKPPC